VRFVRFPRLLTTIFFLITLSGCSGWITDRSKPVVYDGTIDTGGRLDRIELVGRWAFWPGQFIYPAIDSENFDRYEYFPASWSVYRPEAFAAKGYGSYAVTIRGLNPSTVYAFRFPAYSCAARYFANGRELYSQGSPGNNARSERPEWQTAVVPVPVTGARSVTLVMHLSNFNDIFPASAQPVVFGTYENLSLERAHLRLLQIIPFGMLLAMGAYFLALFVFNRKEKACFWLALLAGVFALRIICYDQYIIHDILPLLPAIMVFRLGYLTYSLALAGFAGFILDRHPSICRKAVIGPVIGISLAYGLANLLAPISFSTLLLVPFQVFSLVVSAYAIYTVIRAALERQDGARSFLAGFTVFIGLTVHDILLANRIFDGAFLAHYGFLLMVGVMGLIILRHFSYAFTTVEKASEDLAKLNESLARFVPDDFLKFLGKKSITELCLGDNIRTEMCVMAVTFRLEALNKAGSGASRLTRLEVFNNLLLRLNPVILAHNGYIDRYGGDGLTVLFPDEACNAVRCALGIQRAIDDYNAERRDDNLPPFVFCAGLSRGPLSMGMIGEPGRFERTIISDVLTVANRLMQLAVDRRLSIVISAEVAVPLGGLQPCPCFLVPHGDVRLHGRNEPVSVFEVRGS